MKNVIYFILPIILIFFTPELIQGQTEHIYSGKTTENNFEKLNHLDKSNDISSSCDITTNYNSALFFDKGKGFWMQQYRLLTLVHSDSFYFQEKAEESLITRDQTDENTTINSKICFSVTGEKSNLLLKPLPNDLKTTDGMLETVAIVNKYIPGRITIAKRNESYFVVADRDDIKSITTLIVACICISIALNNMVPNPL